MIRYLSFGAGVNSTAILILAKQGKVKLDFAIFADTGAEHPETYSYLENVAIPFCDSFDLKLWFVKSKLFPLYDYYFQHQIIPARIYRHCTDKFKIQPIRKFLQENYSEELKNGEIKTIMGICADESRRARNWGDNDYPLIKESIDRQGCIDLINKAGLPIPRKSGCYCCPFTPRLEWLNLLNNYPALFLKAEALEKNGQRYPEFLLSNKPLERVRTSIEEQHKLTEYFEEEMCSFCEISVPLCKIREVKEEGSEKIR